MIWMKLTQTDAVFSRTTMVLFLCGNKSSRIGTKLCDNFLFNKREFVDPRPTGGGHLGGHNPPGRPLQARPGGLSPPGGPTDPETDAIKSHISRKKSVRKNYRVWWDRAAAVSCSSLEGQIWSPFGAPERGIFILRCHQLFSIANCMMLPTGSE